jgi:hypothetical protein
VTLRVLAPILCLTTIALAPAAPVPTRLLPKPFYATAVGAKWVYQQGDEEWTEVVTAVERKDGVLVVSVGRVEPGGKVTPDHKEVVSDLGLTRVEALGVKLDHPLCPLKVPGPRCAEWVVDRGELAPLTCTARGSERVRVPAGEFDAVRVDGEFRLGEGRVWAGTRWYARGVGLVKKETPLTAVHGETEDCVETVLKSFTPGQQSP